MFRSLCTIAKKNLPSAQTTLTIAASTLSFLTTMYLPSFLECEGRRVDPDSPCVISLLGKIYLSSVMAAVSGIFTQAGIELYQDYRDSRRLHNFFVAQREHRISSVIPHDLLDPKIAAVLLLDCRL